MKYTFFLDIAYSKDKRELMSKRVSLILLIIFKRYDHKTNNIYEKINTLQLQRNISILYIYLQWCSEGYTRVYDRKYP